MRSRSAGQPSQKAEQKEQIIWRRIERTSNTQNSAVRKLARDRVLDLLVRLIIHGRSGFVQDKDLGIQDDRAREGYQRAL